MYNQSALALLHVHGSLIQGPDSKAEQYQRLTHPIPELMHLIAAINAPARLSVKALYKKVEKGPLNQLVIERIGWLVLAVNRACA